MRWSFYFSRQLVGWIAVRPAGTYMTSEADSVPAILNERPTAQAVGDIIGRSQTSEAIASSTIGPMGLSYRIIGTAKVDCYISYD